MKKITINTTAIDKAAKLTALVGAEFVPADLKIEAAAERRAEVCAALINEGLEALHKIAVEAINDFPFTEEEGERNLATTFFITDTNVKLYLYWEGCECARLDVAIKDKCTTYLLLVDREGDKTTLTRHFSRATFDTIMKRYFEDETIDPIDRAVFKRLATTIYEMV